MTFPPVTVTPGNSSDAAWTASHARLKRLPVTDHKGRLVGVVSRIDRLRALIRDDQKISAEVESVIRHHFLLDPGDFEVTVGTGVVTLAGRLDPALVPKLLEAVQDIEDVPQVVVPSAARRRPLSRHLRRRSRHRRTGSSARGSRPHQCGSPCVR